MYTSSPGLLAGSTWSCCLDSLSREWLRCAASGLGDDPLDQLHGVAERKGMSFSEAANFLADRPIQRTTHPLICGSFTPLTVWQGVLTSSDSAGNLRNMRNRLRCFHSPIRVPAPLRLAVLLFGIVLGVAMAIVRHVSHDDATATKPALTSEVSSPSLRVASHGWSLRSVAEEAELPTIFRCDPRPISDALRQTESTPRGGDFRHSELSVSLVPRGGSIYDQSLLRLHHSGSRQPAFPHPPLEILFCTWQT